MRVEEVPRMEEITTTVEIADRTEHAALQLTKSETVSSRRTRAPGSSREERWSNQHSWLRPTGVPWGPSGSCLVRRWSLDHHPWTELRRPRGGGSLLGE